MGCHHHKRGRQTLDTLYYQGRADGRRGRPYTMIHAKKLRGVWYWHEDRYWQGYRDGKCEGTPWVLAIWQKRWARQVCYLFLASGLTVAILSLL